MAKIENSRIFIFNGRGLESWTDNIEKNIDPNKTLMVGASMEWIKSAELIQNYIRCL